MNLIFLIGDTIVTPALSDTILAGITRNSVLALAKEWGMKVEERKVSIDEILKAHADGILNEVFGVGTAATVAQIIGIGHVDNYYPLPPVEDRKFSTKVDETLRNIRKGKIEDTLHWMFKI